MSLREQHASGLPGLQAPEGVYSSDQFRDLLVPAAGPGSRVFSTTGCRLGRGAPAGGCLLLDTPLATDRSR